MDDLYSLSLVEAVRRLSSSEMTSEAYTRGLLVRIDQIEERVQAWQWLDKERALESAREADTRRTQCTVGTKRPRPRDRRVARVERT